MKRSLLVEGRGIPLDRVLAPANRHDSPLLAGTLDELGEIGPLPDDSPSTSTSATTRARPAPNSGPAA